MYYQFLLDDLRSATDAALLSPLVLWRKAFFSPVILSLLSVLVLLLVHFLQQRRKQQKRQHTIAEVMKRIWPTYSLTKTVADPWAWDFEAVEESSSRTRKRKKRPYHRRTSHMSAIAANRKLLEEALAVKQNVINIIFYFDSNQQGKHAA